MSKRRTFTAEFKAEVVFEVLSGSSSQAEVCRCHNLNENQLSQWKRQLLENAPSLFASTDKQSSEILNWSLIFFSCYLGARFGLCWSQCELIEG